MFVEGEEEMVSDRQQLVYVVVAVVVVVQPGVGG